MESEDETDWVNNISKLYSSQEPEPFKHYFNNKRLGKGKKERSPRDYLNRLLND